MAHPICFEIQIRLTKSTRVFHRNAARSKTPFYARVIDFPGLPRHRIANLVGENRGLPNQFCGSNSFSASAALRFWRCNKIAGYTQKV